MNNSDAQHLPKDRAAANTRRFGLQLRAFRETYSERVAQRNPRTPQEAPVPRMRLSALALIDCLSKSGYPITSGAYSEIESGNSIPRDVQAFLEAVSSCLQLTNDERQILVSTLGYDLVFPRLGEQAGVILRRTASTARALRRWRTQAELSYEALATCLMEHGLTLDMYPDVASLAFFLELLEFGRPWGLSDQDRATFLEKIAECLGEEARQELALGFADDLLRQLLPNVKPVFGEGK